jgi:hypothetical protein
VSAVSAVAAVAAPCCASCHRPVSYIVAGISK